MKSYEIIVAGLIKLCLYKIKLPSITSISTYYYKPWALFCSTHVAKNLNGRNDTPRSTSEFRPPSVASLLPFPPIPRGWNGWKSMGFGLKRPVFAEQPWGVGKLLGMGGAVGGVQKPYKSLESQKCNGDSPGPCWWWNPLQPFGEIIQHRSRKQNVCVSKWAAKHMCFFFTSTKQIVFTTKMWWGIYNNELMISKAKKDNHALNLTLIIPYFQSNQHWRSSGIPIMESLGDLPPSWT